MHLKIYANLALVVTVLLFMLPVSAVATSHTDDGELRVIKYVEDEEYVIGDQRTPVKSPILGSE